MPVSVTSAGLPYSSELASARLLRYRRFILLAPAIAECKVQMERGVFSEKNVECRAKSRIFMKVIILITASMALCASSLMNQSAHAQGTAFSYQGRLNDGAGPATGGYDLRFTLYATNNTGNAVAGPVTNLATAVSGGLFTTIIDFGHGVLTGGASR